jgi:uncharacterized membrane protein YdjX (TVP38/TMEM64 family)
VVALGVVALGFVILGKALGLDAWLTVERIRSVTQAAGFWGPVVFIVVFCAGELLHIPGMVFVSAAVVAYGRATGGLLGVVGALVSVSVSFLVVRGIGGKPLGAIRWQFARRLLSHLESSPIRTIALLRLFLWMAPSVNYALALSNVRFRSYLVGSALGLLAPVTAFVLLSDMLLH